MPDTMRTHHKILRRYSNLIEITRPTVRGNVPGFRTAATTVSDRSKPFVGAFVLLEHYRKFGDLWIVELLYPSLLMWLKWIARSRVGKNGLVFLGTDNLPRQYADGAQCTAEAARWESGLDNSPMWESLALVSFVSFQSLFSCRLFATLDQHLGI